MGTLNIPRTLKVLLRKRQFPCRKSRKIWDKSGFGVWGGIFIVSCIRKVKSGPKAPYNYSTSFRTSNVHIGKTRKPFMFMVFGFFGRVHDSQSQLFSTLVPPHDFKTYTNIPNHVTMLIFHKSQNHGNRFLLSFGKDVDRKS